MYQLLHSIIIYILFLFQPIILEKFTSKHQNFQSDFKTTNQLHLLLNLDSNIKLFQDLVIYSSISLNNQIQDFNRISKIQIDPNLIIVVINPIDIAYPLFYHSLMIKKKDIILLKQFLNQENHPYFKYTIKQRILQIFQQIFKDQDISHVQVIINSILHIQWSLGDEIINTQFNIQNQNCLNSKYKWKMIKFYDNQKITNLSQLKKQQIFFQIKQLQKCLTKKSDLEILNKIINQIRLDLRSIYEEYSPICDVHPISFINSTSVDETLQYQEKLDKIIVSQENSEFDNDKFEQLLNKKKIEKRTYQKKFNFGFQFHLKSMKFNFQNIWISFTIQIKKKMSQLQTIKIIYIIKLLVFTQQLCCRKKTIKKMIRNIITIQ